MTLRFKWICLLVAWCSSSAAQAKKGPSDTIRVIRLDFDKVPSPEDQDEIRNALCDALQKQAVVNYCIGRSEMRMIPLTTDRDRIKAGTLVGARLLVEASVYHD